MAGEGRFGLLLVSDFYSKDALRYSGDTVSHDYTLGPQVTATALRRTFLELARNEGNTAILVTHQLEEAIDMGGRVLVFGRPGRLLADIDVRAWPSTAVAGASVSRNRSRSLR